MKEKLKRLRRDKIKAGILIVILIGCLALLTTVLLTATNVINIDKLSARVTSLNASVIDADSEVNAAASYDELTYKFNITKEDDDEAIITGTLTDAESKYARFKESNNADVTNNGKQITLRTTSSKPKIIVIVSNAPYGTVINPNFIINSEDQNKKNISTDPVTITTSSIEGTIKDENNNSIGGLELSLSNIDGEIKRTYADSDGKYVFSLPEAGDYNVNLKEEKYRIVRYEETTTNENKRILNIIVEEITPFTLDIKKTINKLDLVIDGKKQTFNYNDETKVIKNIKKAKTIEGSITYKIYVKNIGEENGTLTLIKDILHDGLSFDSAKNPGWTLKEDNLYYTVFEDKNIDVGETVEANLILDIKKTNEARNYINEVIGKGEIFKNVVFIINNNIFKEEYVIQGEKVDSVIPPLDSFEGWYTDKNYTNRYDFTKDVTKNIILYGKLNNTKYNVTFIDKNPSSEEELVVDTKIVPEGEKVDFPTNIPDHSGYTFECWALNDNCINELEVREDTNLYTKYSINNYIITYDLDGGILDEENPSTYTVKNEITLHNPTKEGYTFLGWTGTNITEPTEEVIIPKGSIGDRSYTAHFEIKKSTLSINPRGGSYEDTYGIVQYTEDYGTMMTISPSIKKGYTFKRYNKVGGGFYVNNVFTFDDVDAELNAIYEINTYTITYNNLTEEERQAINNPTTYNVETNTFTLTNPDNRKDIHGYNSEDFLGWDDGSGNVSLTITIPTGSIGNREYTAVWKTNEDEYSITYDLKNGILQTPNPNTYSRTTETFTLNNPTKEGYTFTGWSGTGITDLSTEVIIAKGSSGNRFYDANYNPITYTISYEGLTNEEIAILQNPINYNIESEELSLNNPSRQGYTFTGWSGTDITDKSTNVKIPSGSIGNRTYTANFEKISYNISYQLHGGTATNPNSYNIETETFTLNNPTKEGYTFTGWSGTDLIGSDNKNVSISKGSIGDRNYEAHYTPIVYNIIYDYAGGTLDDGVTNPSTYTIESETITFNSPSKEGYTFKHYLENDSIISEIPTGSTGDKHLVAEYDINRFNVNFYNGEELFGSEIVDYNKKALPLSDNPTKAHNIFLYWSEDGVTEYNFDTLITANKNLYAVYEEVLAPTIELNPVLDNNTNKTWVCDNINDENCGVTLSITSASEEYETYYKIGSGEYTLYTVPVKIYSNETVSAFSKKKSINSIENSKSVNNVDKINPLIKEDSITTKVAAFSIKLSGKIVDNESGIKYYELYILDEDRDLLPSDLPYMTSETYTGNHEEVDIDFKFTGLENLSEYKMFVKAYDYVGNSEVYGIKAVTTDYVARIIGRSNIPYSDESQWEKFESVQDAIDACETMQCTIQINPEVVNESVEINSGQDITLDIDNKILTSGSNQTLKINENGKFTLIDNSQDHGGMITNTLSKAIVNNGIFTLGEGSSEQSTILIIPDNYPVVDGAVIGLDNYGTFYFFDGLIKSSEGEGHSAAVDNNDAETITQYPYNAIMTRDADKLVETLQKVDDPEARIKSVYYTKLKSTTGVNAVDSSNNGSYENNNVRILSQIKQYGNYGFVYNPNEDSIISANNASYYSEAISYIKVDMTNYEDTQYLLLNTSTVTLGNDYGYVALSETYGDLSNKVLTLRGVDNNAYRILELEPKKTYYIYFGFVKNSGSSLTSDTYFKVNSANIVNKTSLISDLDIIPNDNYYFKKQSNGSYVNTNCNNENPDAYSTAHSYALFDLTNVEEDINLTIYYKTDTQDSNHVAFIDVSDNIYPISYSDTSHRVLTTYGSNDTYKIITLTHGQKNFVHFGFYRNRSNLYTSNTFTIESLSFEVLSDREDVTEDNINHNVDNLVTPDTNEGDQYYFEYLNKNPFVWKNSVNDKNNADVYGAHISENNTYYQFSGNAYATITNPDITLTNYEESVLVEYSTTSTNSMVLYGGSNKEKIAIGFYDTNIMVAGGTSNYLYAKPAGYNDGENHKLFVTYKDDEYELYYDGELQEHLNSTDFWYTNDNIYIGNYRGYNYNFVGNIYQVKVFDSKIAYEDINNTENLLIYLNPNDRFETNIYASNNNKIISDPFTNYSNTISHSYLTYDLSNINKEMRAVINYSIDSEYNSDWGYILVNDTPDMPSLDDTVGRYVKTSGKHINEEVTVKLEKNKVNYIHFYYSKNGSGDYGYDSLIINSIRLFDSNTNPELDNIKTINHTNTSDSIFNLPVARLNENPSTVVLLKDISVNASIEIPEEKQMILDLNGHTLISSVADYLINNKGNLTITDGKYADEIIDYERAFEENERINQEKKEQYEADLAEYEEYAGLCEGCEPSEEYIFDQSLIKKFDFTGEAQEFTPILNGDYLIEVWGASGGKSLCNNSLCGEKSGGGYSKGIINLNTTDKLYIYVGEEGSDALYQSNTPKSFNGGGLGTWDQHDDEAAGAGGGATDIRLLSGEWDNSESLASRIMVAGAGGGSSWTKKSGYGGGFVGGDGEPGYSKGATQTTGYKFGEGKDGEGSGDSDGVAGGGGGYYGGVSYNSSTGETGSGGSGYISGHLGSVAISSSDNLTPRMDSNNAECTDNSALNDITCSYHYSNKIFTDTVMKSGNEEMPTHDGKSTMIGNIGSGYAKITTYDSEAIEEYRRTLPKTYNVKEKPIKNYYETDSGRLYIPFQEDYLQTSNSQVTIESDKIAFNVTDNSLYEVYHTNLLSKNIISGNFKINNINNSSGTLYIGFASTSDLSINDFVEYKTFDIGTYNNKKVNFSVKYDGTDDVYFKIVLEKSSGNSINLEILDLYFDTYNIVSNFSGLAGNITNGSYDIILNNTGATLNIEEAILNINKSNANAIANRGTLTLGEMSTINVSASSAIGILNETTGNMESSPGKINVFGESAKGIKNSSHDPLIENLNIETNKSNQIAINNTNDGNNITYDNINIYGTGLALYNLNDGDVTIQNSSLSSTNNDAITFARDPSNYKFVINSSNIYGAISAEYQTIGRDININNSHLYSTSGNISFGYGKVTIRDSYLENIASDSSNIYSSGNLFVNNSTIYGTGNIIYNVGSSQMSSYAHIEKSTLKMIENNNKACIDNYGTMEIVDTKIDTDYGYNQYGIRNRSNGYLNINGESVISSRYNIAIDNEGYLKIGTLSNQYKNVYNFDYTGSIQEFTVPQTGSYKIEAWGAQGGYQGHDDSSQFLGSNGAYTSGEIVLTEGEKLYINVGSAGLNRFPYNYWRIPYETYLLGSIYNSGSLFSGGATDISLSSEENSKFISQGIDNHGLIKSLRSEESYLQRIMVAGGGAEKYGDPDSISVGQTISNSTGTVTQVNGYAFGYSNDYLKDGNYSGGSGYFGGNSEQGGTSYISGYLGAVAMNGSASNPKCTMAEAANDITCSYHNSGKIFTNTVMKAGNEEMPTHDGRGIMKGNFGPGFVKITYLNGEVTPDTVTDNPKISARNIAINGKGKVEFLDGELNGPWKLNSSIDVVSEGYDLYLTNDGNTVKLKSKDAEPYVAQIGQVKYTSLEYAINAANDGDEIDILEDLIEAYSFEIDKNINIDYNGHSIHTYNSEYLFKNNAKLKVYDSTSSPKENAIYSDSFIVNNGELEVNNLILSDRETSKTLFYNNSKINFNDSTITVNSYDSKDGSQFLFNSEEGEVIINNSTLNAYQRGWQGSGIFIDNYGSLKINNTRYNHSNSSDGIVNRNTGNITLDNINMLHKAGSYELVQNYNELTLKNSNTEAYVYTHNGITTLENNTITRGVINNNGASVIIIKGGTYSNSFSIDGTGKTIDETDNLYSFIMDDGTINTTLDLNSSGIKWIKSGSIIPNSDNAINNSSSTKLILGINDGFVDTKENTKPVITGNKNAIHTTNYDFVIDFYDGILTGEHSTDAIFEKVEPGYQIHRDIDTVNNKEIEYLKKEAIIKDINTNENYYSTNEVNEAISNGSINSGDTLKVLIDIVILELDNPITIPEGLTINFDLNNHLIEQDNEELLMNNGTLVINDSIYQTDHNNGYGKIISKHGEIIKNNGTLTINAGEYESERHSVESTIIENNGTLTINDGTYTKYYDYNDYRIGAYGSIINNKNIATVTGGNFYASSSFVEQYVWKRVENTANFTYLATIFKNDNTGILNVTGGNYSGISEKTWNDRNQIWRSDYYYPIKGQLIDNYGIATFRGITSDNTHIGLNEGSLTFDNVTMNNINNINIFAHPNLINKGDLEITNSNFKTHATFVHNSGNMDIINSTIDRENTYIKYCYFSNNNCYDTEIYRTSYGDVTGYKNSYVIFNSYNSNNDNQMNIINSTITNTNSGDTIENNGLININNSEIESNDVNAINNNGDLNVFGNTTTVTSNVAIGINNSSTATLNLGKPAIEDSEVSKTYPLITGETYGISNNGIFNFYDGYLKGKTHATSGNITTTEAGYTFSNPTETVDNYNVAYLDQIKVIKNVQIDEEYFTIADAVADASSGDTLQMISNDNVLNTASTIVIDKQLTLDLNGYTINQGNNILFRNESTFTINDSNTSGNNHGKIEVASGIIMLDNYGDLIINGGTYNTSSGRMIIKNEALTQEEINNNVQEHSVTLQNNVNMIATDNTILIDNYGKMNIYNGAFIKNTYVYSAHRVITNYKELNIVDLNNDDDPNTSSNLTAPWIYSQGNAEYSSGDIYNTSGATLNIYGGIFNNGGTYDEGSIEPDVVYIVYNEGTANIKNLDNYSFGVSRNQYGTINIENSHFYNLKENGIGCIGGNINIKNTIFETSGTLPDLYEARYELNLTNATLDHVTITRRNGYTIGKPTVGFAGTSSIKDSIINVTNSTSKSIENTGNLRIENTSININHPFNNTGNINFVNSNLTSSSNGFTNEGVLNISGTSSIASTTGLGIYNSNSNSIINLGTQDGVVDTTIPIIEGNTYGIDTSITGAKLNFFDGIIKGSQGPSSINGSITTTEGGYIPDYISASVSDDGKYQVKLKDGSSTVVVVAKVGNISFSSQDDPYVTTTEALQLAINNAANSGRGVDLLIDITLTENISSTSPVTIYKNGHTVTIPTGITTTNITFADGQAPLASLAKLLSNVAGSGDEENNIVIYEMNDGTSLITTRTYKLYLNGNLIRLNEEEAGIYSYRGNTEEIRPIKNKIYINNLTSGNYKLKSSDNKELDFSIDNDGNITGNVKKYNKSDSSSSVYATSIAELIIAIQTGMIRTNYLLLIIPIIIIILLLLILIRSKQKKIS